MDLAERLDSTIGNAVAANRIVGAVTLVARDGDVVYRKAQGWFDREANKPMFPEAIFRLASVTKPIVSVTALALIERGLLGIDNAVSDYLAYFRPTLKDGSEARISIRHLLTHTSGLGGDYSSDPLVTTGLQDTNLSIEENLTRVARFPLLFAPGTGWNYAMSTDVLGAIVAAVTGGTLGEAVAQYVTGPLGMTDTAFSVVDRARLAPAYADGDPPHRMAEREPVRMPDGAVLQFWPNRILNPRAYQSAGAGMAGTIDDFFKLLEAIRRRGDPILRPEIVAEATRNQVGDLPRRPHDAGQRFGFIGAVLDDPEAAKSPQGRGTIRWGGVYGHDWSLDPANGITIISMTNTAAEGGNGAFPKDVRNAVYDYTPPA